METFTGPRFYGWVGAHVRIRRTKFTIAKNVTCPFESRDTEKFTARVDQQMISFFKPLTK